MPDQEQKVIVYSSDGCTACDAQKDFFAEHGVDFEERNITENRDYVEELRELGARGTPTTVIGEEVIVGFHRQQLVRRLDL